MHVIKNKGKLNLMSDSVYIISELRGSLSLFVRLTSFRNETTHKRKMGKRQQKKSVRETIGRFWFGRRQMEGLMVGPSEKKREQVRVE